jgi:hypothetical protein
MTGWPRLANTPFGIIEFTVFGKPVQTSGIPQARGAGGV